MVHCLDNDVIMDIKQWAFSTVYIVVYIAFKIIDDHVVICTSKEWASEASHTPCTNIYTKHYCFYLMPVPLIVAARQPPSIPSTAKGTPL